MRILVTNDDGIHAEGLAVLGRIARQLSDDGIGDLAGIGEGPGQLPIRRRQLACRRVIAYRRQQRPGCHFAGRDQLLDSEQVDGGAVEIGVGDNRVSRAQVDADQIAGRAGSSDGLALPHPIH